MQEWKNLENIQEKDLQKLEQSLKNLRIADLEIFISASRMKNLGKAALAHHLSQSAASAAVQRVESAFQIDLCTHEKRRFALTRQGQVLLPKFENVVNEVRDLISFNNEPSIRLVTTHAIASVAVPSLLSVDKIDFQHKRPDQAYGAILQLEADIALVIDNSLWKGVVAAEIGQGYFQLYCRNKEVPLKPVLLPEDQMEVLFLQQTWSEVYGYALPVKSRIPSWSLIAEICAATDEVGFLPDFLGKKMGLKPVLWQPTPYPYRVLAIHRGGELKLKQRFDQILQHLCRVFSKELL